MAKPVHRTFLATWRDWYLQSGTRLSAVYEREATGIRRRTADDIVGAVVAGETVTVRRPTRAEYDEFMLPWVHRFNLTPLTEFHVPENEEKEEAWRD